MPVPSIPGNFVKLMVLAYADQACTQLNAPPYIALINPQNYSLLFATEFNDPSAPGQPPQPQLFIRTKPKTMDFKFLFDATGAIFDPNPSSVFEPVDQQISDFMELTFNYDGDTHDTPFLKIIWGPTVFTGKFTCIHADYKLFDSFGTPLRVMLTCTFKQSETAAAQQDDDTDPSSPDLTHARIVVAGDTLPLLCHEIYNDSSYYLQVAQFNNMSNFRSLKVGSTLYFPPLD